MKCIRLQNPEHRRAYCLVFSRFNWSSSLKVPSSCWGQRGSARSWQRGWYRAEHVWHLSPWKTSFRQTSQYTSDRNVLRTWNGKTAAAASNHKTTAATNLCGNLQRYENSYRKPSKHKATSGSNFFSTHKIVINAGCCWESISIFQFYDKFLSGKKCYVRFPCDHCVAMTTIICL